MDITKLIGILSLGISVLAALVSLGVLLQMRKDTLLARHDSELRIRPIVFVRGVFLDVDSDGSVTSMNVSVVNAGLGPALNVGEKGPGSINSQRQLVLGRVAN